MLAWIAAENALTSAALTVRAQTISPNDLGRLYYPLFFPRVNVDSTRIQDISTIDFRPVSDRREWNARGRLITQKTPPTTLTEMVPIEDRFTVDEQEIQRIIERVIGNQALFRQIVGTSIPQRVDVLAAANYRRLELDSLKAWSTGTIVVRNPMGLGADKTVNLGFAADRYLASSAWTALGANAYERFVAFMEAAVDKIGAVGGAVTRLAVFKAIQAAAPQGVNAVPLTRAQTIARLADDLGVASFQFVLIEDSHDVYDDGGLTTTRTKAWPTKICAALPSDFRVGSAFFAPVARAYEIVQNAPDSGIDINGNTVYREFANGGRELLVECQMNALSIPDEQRLYVIDTGII